jgi:hypothetical protein
VKATVQHVWGRKVDKEVMKHGVMRQSQSCDKEDLDDWPKSRDQYYKQYYTQLDNDAKVLQSVIDGLEGISSYADAVIKACQGTYGHNIKPPDWAQLFPDLTMEEPEQRQIESSSVLQ